MIGRRGFLTGLVALMAAPAIVRVESLMPVRSPAIIRVSPINLAEIRNLLLPGLLDVRGSVDMIPRQWERIFAESCL